MTIWTSDAAATTRFAAYATSKLENILFVRELSSRCDTGTAVAVHPGNVATAFGCGSFFPGFFYELPIKRLYLIAAEEGAAPLLRLAAMPDPRSADGLYYDRFKPRGKTSRQADDPDLARGVGAVGSYGQGLGCSDRVLSCKLDRMRPVKILAVILGILFALAGLASVTSGGFLLGVYGTHVIPPASSPAPTRTWAATASP